MSRVVPAYKTGSGFFMSSIIFLLTFCGLAATLNAEMYNSMHKMKEAFTIIKNNRSFEKTLDNCLEDGLLPMKNEIQDILTRLRAIDSFENPVAIFDWLYHTRKLRKWLIIENFFGTYFSEFDEYLATDEDVNGAADGIQLLQWLYEIAASKIVTGTIKDLSVIPQPLTSPQIDFLAKRALEKNYAKMSTEWLIESVKNKDGRQELFTERKLRKMLNHTTQEVEDLTILTNLFNICVFYGEMDLAIKFAQIIQVSHGYHYSGFVLSDEKFGPNVKMLCLDLRSLEAKLEMTTELDDNAENENAKGNLDYCLQDVEEFEEEGAIVRSAECRLSAPSAFHTIAPLKEEIISEEPEIKLWHDFVHDSEIETMLRKSVDGLFRSEIIFGKSSTRIGQSSGFVLPSLERRMNNRIAAATGLRVNEETSEIYQVTNYGLGGLYMPHYDAKSFTGSSSSEGARLATVLMYLEDVKLGGATIFPKLNIAVNPEKGMAVIWYNLSRRGTINEDLFHGGCPVVSGNKWISNKWIFYHGQQDKRLCKLHRNAS